MKVLEKSKLYLSVGEIIEKSALQSGAISKATVYRTIFLMAKNGTLDKKVGDDRIARYSFSGSHAEHNNISRNDSLKNPSRLNILNKRNTKLLGVDIEKFNDLLSAELKRSGLRMIRFNLDLWVE